MLGCVDVVTWGYCQNQEFQRENTKHSKDTKNVIRVSISV